jgi:hypothetical protein
MRVKLPIQKIRPEQVATPRVGIGQERLIRRAVIIWARLDASLHDLIWTPVRLPLSRSTRFGFEDVFGTPDRVALAMGEIMAEVGGDGFMLSAPVIEGDKPAKKKFKAYPIGFFHIDIAEVRTEEGKLYLFVAIDRTSKFAFVAVVKT